MRLKSPLSGEAIHWRDFFSSSGKLITFNNNVEIIIRDVLLLNADPYIIKRYFYELSNSAFWWSNLEVISEHFFPVSKKIQKRKKETAQLLGKV